MSTAPLRLWFGRTLHRRETPFVRAFSYAVALVDLDIDALAAANASSRLFSVNRSNLIAFHETDHGARDGAVPLRVWAEKRLAEAGVALQGGAIRLLTFPRVLGYGFAPISVWFGHGPEGDLRGVIYEVHNTFGQTHAYVTPGPDAPHLSDKEFFVSPFFDVSGGYRFTLRPPGEKLDLVIENLGAAGRSHLASLALTCRPVSDRAILGWLAKMPASGLGALLAIHWQALLLFIRGARYHIKPVQRANRTTLAPSALRPTDQADPRKRA